MLALDLFEFLGGVLVIRAAVQQEHTLVIKLVGRLVGPQLLLFVKQVEAAAGAERGNEKSQAQKVRQRRTPKTIRRSAATPRHAMPKGPRARPNRALSI